MECAYHPNREPVGMCVACGKFICIECKTVLKDKIYCNSCANEFFVEDKSESTQLTPEELKQSETKDRTSGAPLRQKEPSAKQSIKEQGPTTVWTKLGLSRRTIVAFIVVFIVVMVGSVVIGTIIGLVNGITAGVSYPSPDQLDVISEHGNPPLWLLSDGPVKPGGEIHRIELWLYPNNSTQFNYIDGSLVSKSDISPTAPVNVKSPVNPSNLNRDMTLQDVQKLLGEKGELIDTFKSEIYPSSKAFQFPESRLVASFLNGKLFTIQVY